MAKEATHLACLKCGQMLNVRVEDVGKRRVCPSCGHVYLIGRRASPGPAPLDEPLKAGAAPPADRLTRDPAAIKDEVLRVRTAADERARLDAEAAARRKTMSERRAVEERVRADLDAAAQSLEAAQRQADAWRTRAEAEAAARVRAEAERRAAEERLRAAMALAQRAREEAERRAAEHEAQAAVEAAARRKAEAERQAALARSQADVEAARETERKAAEHRSRLDSEAAARTREEAERIRSVVDSARRERAEAEQRAAAAQALAAREAAARAEAERQRQAAEEQARLEREAAARAQAETQRQAAEALQRAEREAQARAEAEAERRAAVERAQAEVQAAAQRMAEAERAAAEERLKARAAAEALLHAERRRAPDQQGEAARRSTEPLPDSAPAATSAAEPEIGAPVRARFRAIGDPVRPGTLYGAFFGFRSAPFGVTPDPHFFFPSSQHEEALASLLYAVTERKGFALLTGEIGAGKTTVARTLLSRLDPSVLTALVLNTRMTGRHLLAAVCQEFDLAVDSRDRAAMHAAINRHLLEQLAQDRNVVLLIDEAQNLGRRALEEIRMISNLETATEKLIQIVLMGQSELQRLIERPELEQLRQRIAVRFHLTGLTAQETAEYVAHRLRRACEPGMRPTADGLSPFTSQAVREVAQASHGIPRLINLICDQALLTGFVRQTKEITDEIVREAAADLSGAPRSAERFERGRLSQAVAAARSAIGGLRRSFRVPPGA